MPPLAVSDGFQVLRVPARSEAETLVVGIASDLKAPEGFKPRLSFEGPLWAVDLPSQRSSKIAGDGVEAETLAFLDAKRNPWQTQWRPGGLDFFADGQRLAVCSWMGDV